MHLNSVDDSYFDRGYGLDEQHKGPSFNNLNYERIDSIPKKMNSNNNFDQTGSGFYGVSQMGKSPSIGLNLQNSQQGGSRLLNKKMIKPTLLKKDESSAINNQSSMDLGEKSSNIFAALGAPPIQRPKQAEIPGNESSFIPVNIQRNAMPPATSLFNQQPKANQQQQFVIANNPINLAQQRYNDPDYSTTPSPAPIPQHQQPIFAQQQPPQPQQFSNYAQQPNQNYNSGPSLSDLFRQRRPAIEANFSNSLDRSMNNVKRIFANEFQTIIRQSQTPTQLLDIGEFSESLKSEINDLISSPIASLDLDSASIARKVTAAIDEYTKPVTIVLSEAASRNSLAADHHISELRQLQDELDTLHNILRVSTDNIIKELQRESQNTSSIIYSEQVHYRELEQKMRTLKLKYAELEGRSNRQKSEREAFDHESKSFEAKRIEWEEETLPMIYNEGGVLRQKIMQQLSELKSKVEHESFDDVIDAVNEGISLVKEESDNIKNELQNLEIANRLVISRLHESQMMRRSQFIPPPSVNTSFAAQNEPKSARRQMPSVVDEAQEKLQLIRRKREEALKDISDI